jgi:hypothetical protein
MQMECRHKFSVYSSVESLQSVDVELEILLFEYFYCFDIRSVYSEVLKITKLFLSTWHFNNSDDVLELTFYEY